MGREGESFVCFCAVAKGIETKKRLRTEWNASGSLMRFDGDSTIKAA